MVSLINLSIKDALLSFIIIPSASTSCSLFFAGRKGAHRLVHRLLQRPAPACQHRHESPLSGTHGAGPAAGHVEGGGRALGGCLPPCRRAPPECFSWSGCAREQSTFPVQSQQKKMKSKQYPSEVHLLRNRVRSALATLRLRRTSPVKAVNFPQASKSTFSVRIA